MAELLYRLGKGAARRAWIAIVAWVAVLGIAAGGFAIGFSALSPSFDIPNTASSKVTDELSETLPDFAGANGTVVFHTTDGSALTTEQQQQIADLVANAGSLPDVAEVRDPFDIEQQRADAATELENARAQIDAGRAELDAGETQLDASQAELDGAQAQLDEGRAQLASGIAAAEAAGAPEAQLAAMRAQLEALEGSQAEIDGAQAQLDEARAQLEQGRAELTDGEAELARGAELIGYSDGIRVVSEDGSAALVSVAFTETRMELAESSKQAVIDYFSAADIDGVEVDFSTEISQGIPQILGVSEIVGVAIAAVVLIVMLGSLIAAAFPIITAIVGVGIGALAVLSFSGVVQMTSVTPVLGVMLGLAVGIDYSLFIVNRHRKQLLQGAEVAESVGIANGTAGNAVVFAGSTVIVALLALNVTGIPFLGVMGTAGAVSVLMAVLIAISLTPAMLGLAGTRVLTRKERAVHEAARQSETDAEIASTRAQQKASASPLSRVKPMPTWRAIVTTLVAVVALLVIAIPSLSMRLGLPDGGSEPVESTSHQAFTVVDEQFGEGSNGTLLVTATPTDPVAEEDVIDAQLTIVRVLAEQDDVVAVAPIAVSDDGALLAFQIVPAEGPNSESTTELVHALRALEPIDGEFVLGVAGQAAMNIDISQNLQDVLPLYLAVVVGLSLIIMIVVFRSLLVPLIATGGFILSLFATFGAIVATFQWGWFTPVFGSSGPILSFLPVILIGILFGLAMDYQLFLATGMREAYVHGASARLAVARGFRAGRSVVIAAGLIMVAVFGGFVFSDSVIIRVLGFGLAFGVLVDAFIVRLLLMPALMHLIGKSAWWIPRWLDRIMPDVDVEGASLERRHALH